MRGGALLAIESNATTTVSNPQLSLSRVSSPEAAKISTSEFAECEKRKFSLYTASQ